jgi:hypothetical protein
MSKPMVMIESWAVVRSGAYAAYEELEPGNILTGKVFGHDKMPDGKSIFTSPIISVDSNQGIIETRNTLYQLGDASEDYQNSDEYRSWDREHRARFAA